MLRSTGRPRGALVILLAVLTLVAASSLRFADATAVVAQVGDLRDLAVAPGYSIEIDSSGFDLPTAIAFIPQPGTAADSPLYFVAELQGSIKVVTRDRTVHDFADVPTWGHQGHDLDGASQQGLAGLCLDPDNGYLFATYTEPDEGGVLRNRVVRFASQPGVFGLSAASATPIAPVLASVQSAPAHQIGGCTIHGGELYVGVGDGGNPREVSNPDVLLGKIICMSFDGSPCRQRAFGGGDAPAVDPVAGSSTFSATDYVFATGFRNPFGLVWLDGDLKVIENGIRLDRFLTAVPGRDHLWNGTDESIASLAEIILPRPFAPVQLDYVPAGTSYMEP
ncbi:MAG TPA: PQQ-dependent sugar dehydrogenase, partial [Trueperaceae bacterium]|nr:PQQ-dependent sugar dehydrogenase [Trueperaceae bacterium]